MPVTPLADGTFNTAITDWFDNPSAAQFTDANNVPYYGLIGDWDVSQVTTMANAFKDKSTFNDNISRWDVSNVTIMTSMFSGATIFNQNIGGWNVGKVNTFAEMFIGTAFNQDIGNWQIGSDPSVITINMSGMFQSTTAFNQDIGGWDTSKVTNMQTMFRGTKAFNQYIGNWDVSNVTNALMMFYSAMVFNQNIGGWDVSGMKFVHYMFNLALKFNQNIRQWDVSSVSNIVNMFDGAPEFNQNISFWTFNASLTNFSSMFAGISGMVGNTYGLTTPTPLKTEFGQSVTAITTKVQLVSVIDEWIADSNAVQFTDAGNTPYYGTITWWDVSQVTDMSGIFSGNTTFNSDISGWYVGNVTNMSSMFSGATAFNQNIGGWLVRSVTNMSSMFSGATTFNQNIGGWPTNSATNMSSMFSGATAFNQDIGVWKVSSVTNMSSMFSGASAFNQDIGGWATNSATNMSSMFSGASAFNQDISTFRVYSVTNMNNMFDGATLFVQDISYWKIQSSSTTFTDMFANSGMVENTYGLTTPTPLYSEFNQVVPITNANIQSIVNDWISTPSAAQFTDPFSTPYFGPISSWDVSLVTNMDNLFKDKSTFNGDIGNWNVSNVTTMSGLFQNAIAFNRVISNWNMANVQNMSYMFAGASAFNQPIGLWDTSGATTMAHMMDGATVLYQKITLWVVQPATDLTLMLQNSGFSTGSWGLSVPTPLYTQFNQPHPLKYNCFLEGTCIETDRGQVAVEKLRKNDLIKTYNHGYMPLKLIGVRVVKHMANKERIKDQLYVCPKSKFPDATDDLVVTGCHSLLLFRDFKDDFERSEVERVNKRICVTDGIYRFPACILTEDTEVYPVKGTFNIYHFALAHDDVYINYGVYSNGLLTETASIRTMNEYSDMTFIGGTSKDE